MKIESDWLIFSTGRTEYANCGIVGIDKCLNISGGYDGGLPAWKYYDTDTDSLTKAEREELADYMIGLWQQFKIADKPLDEE